MDTAKVIRNLELYLPMYAAQIAHRNQRLPASHKERFLDNLDSAEEHDPEWHQWGIITHSRKFRAMHENHAALYVRNWGLQKAVEDYLSEKIDDVPKAHLIKIAMPVHDLGKFMKGIKENERFDFDGHEEISEQIIQSPEFRRNLKDLTDKQVEYVAECAGLHYKLGVVRKKARDSGDYTIAFTQSSEFADTAEDLASNYPDMAPEIGLLFLADSLAKTDILISAETDAEIETHDRVIKHLIDEKQLSPKIIRAVKQLPVNAAAAKEYLKLVF
jgi:hypothetical protein